MVQQEQEEIQLDEATPAQFKRAARNIKILSALDKLLCIIGVYMLCRSSDPLWLLMPIVSFFSLDLMKESRQEILDEQRVRAGAEWQARRQEGDKKPYKPKSPA